MEITPLSEMRIICTLDYGLNSPSSLSRHLAISEISFNVSMLGLWTNSAHGPIFCLEK